MQHKVKLSLALFSFFKSFNFFSSVLIKIMLHVLFFSLAAGDFEIATFDMTLSVNQIRACVNISITDDADLDPDEVFDVNLATSTFFVTIRENTSSAVVTIEDNDEREFLLYQKEEIIRASVDALCRDGTSEISRDPRLQTRRKSLARPSKHTNNNF